MTDETFRAEALAFVREHNCAGSTGIELIELALRAGAALAVADTARRVQAVRQRLADQRARNFSG